MQVRLQPESVYLKTPTRTSQMRQVYLRPVESGRELTIARPNADRGLFRFAP
jgi:hypothetical protein